MKLFLIDSDNLRRNLFEAEFGEEIYTLPSFEDASFRIPDFGPDVILVGRELSLKFTVDDFRILKSSEIPFFAICSEEEGESLAEKGWPSQFLKTPIEATSLKSLVENLL